MRLRLRIVMALVIAPPVRCGGVFCISRGSASSVRLDTCVGGVR